MGILDKISGKKKDTAKKPAEKKSDAPKAATEKKGADEAAKAEASKVTRGPLAREGAGDAHRILLKPVFTEKTANLQAAGKYVFVVARGATKQDVARAVRDLYGIKPTGVRMVNIQGKNVRFGRSTGQQKDKRKAIVSLPKGQTLTVFEGA